MTYEWIHVLSGDYYSLDIPGVEIVLEARPPYCDRGRWSAKIFPDYEHEKGRLLARGIDGADMFPRYYFDLDRAKIEMECWIEARKELR